MRQPAHDELVFTQQLHTVYAEVHALFFRAAGNNKGPGYQWANIARPAGLNWQLAQINVISGVDDLLTGRVFDHVGPHGQYFLEQRCFINEIAEALGRIRLSKIGQQLSDVPKCLY